MRRAPRSLSARRGFTLVEVVLAMAVMALLVGVLYAIVDASISAAAELEARGNRSRQVNGFLELCRRNFHSMPATAQIETRMVQHGDKYFPEIIFRDAPQIFRWGNLKDTFGTTILGVRPKLGGLLDIGILQDTGEGIESYLRSGEPTHPWLILMTDLRDVQWRFYNSESHIWEKEWKGMGMRPAFAELTISTEEDTSRYVFWLPPVRTQ